MGIRDRDYMKRPPDHDDESGSSTGSKLDAFFDGVLRRHQRLLLGILLALAIAILAAAIVAKISGKTN